MARLWAWPRCAVAGSVPVLAQNKELSDKSVLTLMQYAWAMVPAEVHHARRQDDRCRQDQAQRDVIVPMDMAREVIRVARLSAYAQLCELPEEQRANYQTLMRREEAKPSGPTSRCCTSTSCTCSQS